MQTKKSETLWVPKISDMFFSHYEHLKNVYGEEEMTAGWFYEVRVELVSAAECHEIWEIFVGDGNYFINFFYKF
jgi:hypothetical protein